MDKEQMNGLMKGQMSKCSFNSPKRGLIKEIQGNFKKGGRGTNSTSKIRKINLFVKVFHSRVNKNTNAKRYEHSMFTAGLFIIDKL